MRISLFDTYCHKTQMIMKNALVRTQEIEGVEYVKALSQHIRAQINATTET
jgi:hypothetical protein